MQCFEDLVSSYQKDLWFPQLDCFGISLNKLARHMPISRYVRQERVHPTGRPKPGPGGGNPGRLPVPLPKQNRQRYQLRPSLVNLPGDRQRRVGSCIDAHGENNTARGVPLARPAEWEKRSFLPYYEPPRRGNDLKALIKDSLKLERASIDFFQKLALKTRDSDLITYRMAMDVMAEEARDEQRISALVE